MNKAVVGILAGVAVLAVAAGGYYFHLLQQAKRWSSAEEIVQEESTIKKDGIVTTAHLVSIIAAPIDKVQETVWKVENSSNIIENIKLSELVSQQGNKKVLKMQIKASTLPIQHYTMEFTLDEANRRVNFKTLESQAQDIEGYYQLESSPDGTATRLIYHSVAHDKIQVPFPQSVVEGAVRETFVKMVRGVRKSVSAG